MPSESTASGLVSIGFLGEMACRETPIIGQEEQSMNKADLIDSVASATGLGKSEAGSAVESVLNVITSALQRGESVSLVGFGIFSISERAARVGRNPRTGESITIAPSRAPKFKAGKGLKDAVN